MTDTSIPDIPMEAPQEEKSSFAERCKDFFDSLESLYIQGNISGRLNFRKNWPDAAAYIFCSTLMKYDEDGVDDKERRAVLEIEAEERRLTLVEVLEDVERKSIYHGSLQSKHVNKTVAALGRGIALYVYADHVVDDIIPPAPGEKSAEGQKEETQKSEEITASKPSQDELSPTDLPPLEDNVQPIDVSPPPPSEGGSGLNLAAKRNVVQVDFIYAQPVSYADLVAEAEKETETAIAPAAQNTQSLKMMFNHLAACRIT